MFYKNVIFLVFWNQYFSIANLKILAKCIQDDVDGLDFGWPGGMRGPAGRGVGVKTVHFLSGSGLLLELSL